MADIHDRPPAGAGVGAVPHPPKGAKMSLHSPKERRTPSSGTGAVETVVKSKSSSDAANGSRAAGSDAGVNDVCDSSHEGISLSMGRRTVFPPVPSRSSASSTATSSNPSSSIRRKVPSLHFSPHRTASDGGSKRSARWGDTPRGDWSEASESLSSGAFLTGTRFEEEEEEEEGDCEEEARRLPDITTATPRGGDDSAVKNVAGGAPTAGRGVGGQQLGENDDEGDSESGDLVSPLRRMEPNRDVTRRYFFGNTPEKPLAFLRYFDVHVPKTERFEKIVGGKVESEQNDLMRYYYSEFLAAPPFESSLPLDKRRMDVEDLQEFVDTVNPKTRVDAFPLYVLLKDLVKRIVTKQMELFSREISQSRDRIAGLQEQATHAMNRVESTKREYALRLQKESARLADREMELGKEQKRTRKMKSVAEELGIKVDSQAEEIDRLNERLEEVEGMLESEALKRLSAMREAEALEEKTRTLQSQVKSYTSSTRQLKENLGMIDESGNEVSDHDAAAWAASRSWRNGSKGRRTSVSFHAAMEEVGGLDDNTSDSFKWMDGSFNGSVSFKGSEGGGGLNVEAVLQRMGITERGKALNLLLAQPAVAGLMDDEAVAADLDDYMSDKLLRSLIRARMKREKGDNAEDYDGASLMSSVLKTSMDDEVQKVMRGAVASSGAGWSSKLVAESIGADLESASTLLTAAFDQVKDLAGESASVDAVCKAMRCSNKAEMTRWVLQGDGEVLKEIMSEYPAVVIQAQRTFMAERRGSKSLGRRGSKMGEDLLGASQRNNSIVGDGGEEGWGQRFRRGSFASSMHGGEEGKAPGYMPGGEGGADGVFSLERKHGRVSVQHRETQSEPGHDKGVGTEDTEAEPDDKKTAKGIAAARLLLKKPKGSGGEATSIVKVVNMAKKVRAQMTTQQALKTIAQIFLGKLELDKQSDMHRRARQSLPDYVRDFFTQQFGLPSVARSKLADLMEKLKKDVEGKKCHPRIRLFHNLIGLDTMDSHPSQDQCTFVLSLIQELFPSWRYGQTFVRDFAQPEIKLPMAAVEFAVEKVLTQPKHGGVVPESLRKDIVSKGYRSVMKGKGAGIKAPAGEEILMIDADEVLEICNYHFLELEIKSITALMNLFASCDTNGDGVLQYDEFAALIARIDQYVTQQDVMEMYNECVGDDDVIDKEELLGLISTRGLKFALFQSK